MMKILRRMALFLLLPTLAHGQDRPGVTAYPADYFAANQPGTALDMLALLPGFRLQEGDTSRRGFSGTVGNVLIDGALPASKEESMQAALQRIPAAAVARIELIRAEAGLDMHGYPLLANVVRASEATMRGRAELEDAASHYGLTAPKGTLHLAWQGDAEALDLSASYGREWNGNHGFGSRDRFADDGTALKLAGYAQPELQIAAQASAHYRRGVMDGTLNLTTVAKRQVQYSDIVEDVIFPASSRTTGRDRTLAGGLEAQLHYQHPLGADGNWEMFLLHRADEKDGFSRSDDGSGSDIAQSRRFLRESVARGDTRFAVGNWLLEAGAEAALNILRSGSSLEKNGTPVILPTATVRVEEQRAEVFAQASWHAAPDLTLEFGARQEISRIGQSGDTVTTRDLAFLKPRLFASWQPYAGTELRLLAERRVGQLDFDAFASSASLSSGTVSAGNRDLMPEWALRLEMAWEQHLWDRASVTLTLRRDLVSGALDHLAIVTPAGIFDAMGNIGAGHRDEAELALTLPLAALPGVTLQAGGTARHSSLRDPLTGLRRRFSGSRPLEGRFDVTHDLPQWHLRWGASFALPSQETDYRIDEIDARHHVSRLGAFIEIRPAPAWTVRLFGEDLAQPAFVRDRLLYDGLRGQAPPDAEERRALNNGATLGINLRFDFQR